MKKCLNCFDFCNKAHKEVIIINIIPSPKKIEIFSGILSKKTVNPDIRFDDYRIINATKKLPISIDGIDLILEVSNTKCNKGYFLEIQKEQINIVGDSVASVFYGIQTLRQIFMNDTIHCLRIEDAPDFNTRGIHLDITRGRIPTLDSLKEFVDNLALYKINSMQIYSEHVFELEQFGEITTDKGCITKEEIKLLDAYAYDNFIELIPSVATFGHLYELLQTREYNKLSLLGEYSPKNHFWYEMLYHHTIDPLNPESFELIKSIIDECIPLFRSNKFNICGDETLDLSHGKYEGQDTGEIYIDFVLKIIDYVKSKGKEVMMWPDILNTHPQLIDCIPDDVVLLPYYYLPDFDIIEARASMIATNNKRMCVCPTTYSWCRLIENTQINEGNISLWVEAAAKYKAEGIYNTIWGDYGHPCSLKMNSYGIVLGAEKSWSHKTEIDSAFFSRVDDLVYGQKGALEEIKNISALVSEICYWDFAKQYSNMVYSGELDVHLPTEEQVMNVRKLCLQAMERLSTQRWGKDDYREELLIVAEGNAVIAELFAKIGGYSIERLTNTKNWLNKYSKKWVENNKSNGLSEIEEMFLYFDAIK